MSEGMLPMIVAYHPSVRAFSCGYKACEACEAYGPWLSSSYVKLEVSAVCGTNASYE